MLAYKDLTRGTAVPVSARRVNAGLARARVIEDSRRPRVVSVTELEDKLKDRERRAAVLKHELVAPSVSEVWNEPGLGGDGGSMKIVLSSSSIIAARKQQRRCSMTRLILASLVLAISILPLYAQSTSLHTDRSGYTTGTDGSRTVSTYTDQYGNTTGWVGSKYISTYSDGYGGTTGTIGNKHISVLAGTRSDRLCLVERSGFGVRCR